ncbi:MAG: response regulator [bacterium]|nr:response regulator [bacterium]
MVATPALHQWIYPHLDDLFIGAPLEAVLDRAVRDACEITQYGRAVLTAYREMNVYIALHNLPEDSRDEFRKARSRISTQTRMNKRDRLLREFRVGGSTVCFVPAESDLPKSPYYMSSEKPQQGTWDPDDRLLLLLFGSVGEYYGILSLDEPIQGDRPDPNDSHFMETLELIALGCGRILEYGFHLLNYREHNALWQVALAGSRNGLLVVDRQGHVVDGNLAVTPYLPSGGTPEEWRGQPIESLLPNLALSWQADWDGLFENGIPFSKRISTGLENGETILTLCARSLTTNGVPLGFALEWIPETSVSTEVSEVPDSLEYVGLINQSLSVILGRSQLLKLHRRDDAVIQNHLKQIEAAVHKIETTLDHWQHTTSQETASESKDSITSNVILGVDDDPAMLDLLCDIIELAGETPLRATDGMEAWNVVQRGTIPKLIISDINMPNMNGFDLLKKVKEYNSQIPVVLVTGYTHPDAEESALSSGADAFLVKPFRVDHLLGIIHQFVKPEDESSISK